MSSAHPMVFRSLVLAIATTGFTGVANAAAVQVKVTAENLAPAGSVAFAPLRLGFHGGTFDAFDIGEVAGPEIISVAEGGSGSLWFPAFAATDPGAVLGSVLPAGPFLPGSSASETFTVDTDANPFFTFASMVVPSNDFFIGNDSPTRFRLFDAAGNLQITTILQTSRAIWDAGSEIFDPAAAAFVGTNSLRADQNSVVAFNFAELNAFSGLPTAAGYAFEGGLEAGTPVFRISFEVAAVPEPGTWALMALGAGVLAAVARRRVRTA